MDVFSDGCFEMLGTQKKRSSNAQMFHKIIARQSLENDLESVCFENQF